MEVSASSQAELGVGESQPLHTNCIADFLCAKGNF